MPATRVVPDLLLAALGGLLMFASGYPIEAPWLQLVGVAPLLIVALRSPSRRRAAALGGVWGLARMLPLGVMLDGLGVPPLPAVALALYLLALDASFAALVHVMRHWSLPALTLGAGVSFAAIERLDAALPMWGTARSLARAWAIEPELVGGLLRLAGPHALALVIVALQAVVVGALARRRPSGLALLVPLLAAPPLCGALLPARTDGALRVAAVAWPTRGGEHQAEALVTAAAQGGARLVVLPESAFTVEPGALAQFDARWAALAGALRVHLVVGYRDRDDPGNRLAVFDPAGALVGRYTKTHLIPLSERYPPGDGALLVFEVDGVRVGAMICQDDNFRDLSRAYARAGAELVVVPTNEGPPAVAPYHYRNARLRPIELPLALVRAAARGTSAIVAPGGTIVAARDHPREGAGVVIGDVPRPATRRR